MRTEFLRIIQEKLGAVQQLELFSRVGHHAMSQAAKAVETLDLMRKIAEVLEEPAVDNNEYERAKKNAEEVASFGRQQAEKGNPYLYSLCSVLLWAHLEALVDDLVVSAMQRPHECPDQKTLSKIKGPLVDLLKASPDEQAEFLAEALKQVVDASLKPGLGRFESLLAPVGLGGSVEKDVGQCIYELGQIRNVVMHKGGRVDRRLMQACPWLNLQKGEVIEVDANKFNVYFSSAVWYVLELHGRVLDRFDGARREEGIVVQKEILARIESLLGGAVE